MGLSGHAGAADRAVRTLLDGDRRFLVDEEGVWTLADPFDPGAPALASLRYAVVDVETSGGLRWRHHGIVEIAIVEIADGAISTCWHTLLDPGRPVPPFVTELTGISNDMVGGAPPFENVAAEVLARLEGRVFVAHNVGFDWGFVRSHLQRTLGSSPDVPRLCTVHLARRLVPRLRRRNLDALADHFGIPVHPRHRAFGDALATARVLLRLLDEAGRQGFADLPALQAAMRRPQSRPSASRRS
jgi:DNA polymerase III epsilon subunit family exonuclease